MEFTKKEQRNLYLRDCLIVKKTIENHLGFEICGNRRFRNLVDARKIYFKICRDHIRNASYQMIGETVGLNHATVLVNLKKFNDVLPYDKVLNDLYITLEDVCFKKIEFLKNPYSKYLGKEDHFQHSVMNYIRMQYPGVLAIHCPNEGKRSPFERYKFKYLGGMPGIPDVMIFEKNENNVGLAIELKVGNNKPTPSQSNFLNKLESAGWETHWSNSFDEVQIIIDNYLK